MEHYETPVTASDTLYLSCADTAKYVRQALKKDWPRVKFSVRSSVYSGGASIDISWVGGPTVTVVEPVVKCYAGSGFDGMVDMKYYKRHWLYPDGYVTLAHSPGTHGQKGSHDERFVDPEPAVLHGGPPKEVHWGADFVFTSRTPAEGEAERMEAQMLYLLEGQKLTNDWVVRNMAVLAVNCGDTPQEAFWKMVSAYPHGVEWRDGRPSLSGRLLDDLETGEWEKRSEATQADTFDQAIEEMVRLISVA